ncbi:MAG: TIGR03089 family protein [Kineosporiaceae bacterium]
MSAPPPRTVAELLRTLLVADPGRPRVTWYGTDGERVELSARTLDNWVAKTANLLVEEFDAGPGSVVDVRLPAHWRTVTWLLATWMTGACAAVPSTPAAAATVSRPDVVVTADPAIAVAAGARPDTLVAVALPALATSFGPGLPAGAVDGAAEVRLRGDVFVPLVEPASGDPALAIAGRHPVAHADLLPAAAEAARAARLPPRARLLSSAGPDRAVQELLAPLLVDGSVVLHVPGLDAGEVARIADQEHVTC